MKMTFFGQSAWGVEVSGDRILVDPYPISPDAEAQIGSFADESCRYLLVTHGGYDHIGMSMALMKQNPDLQLGSDSAVVRYFRAAGLDPARCMVIGWNGERVLGRWHVRALETKHWSMIESPQGGVITGFPCAFLIWHESEPEMRLLHLGDTSIFSDLALFGQFYRPTVALIGIGGARADAPAHMSPKEAAQACLWLGVDIALPMHFLEERATAEAFCTAVDNLPPRITAWVPEVGEPIEISRRTSIARG
jgi:L-ascorbate metabolism protein UlaG (beta-lactamase superfamily)